MEAAKIWLDQGGTNEPVQINLPLVSASAHALLIRDSLAEFTSAGFLRSSDGAATPKSQSKSVKCRPEMAGEVMGRAMTPEDMNIGDHIFRYGLYGIYSHHGIYVGNGYVIHFTRTENKKSIGPSLSRTSHKQQSCPNFPECEYQETIKRGVVKTCVDCFRRDGEKLRSLYCYGYGWSRQRFMLTRRGTCTTLPFTKSCDQVVEKASELHANNAFGNYNLMSNNCEHFALFCRTEVRKSEQTAFVNNCDRKIMAAKEWTMSLLQRN